MSALLRTTPLALVLALANGCYAMNPVDGPDARIPTDAGAPHDATTPLPDEDAAIDAGVDYPSELVCVRMGTHFQCLGRDLTPGTYVALNLLCDQGELGFGEAIVDANGDAAFEQDLANLRDPGLADILRGQTLPARCSGPRKLFLADRDAMHLASTDIDLGRR